ncbi:MAG: adenylosuccinate synthetase [Sulfolobales archaeon]|jgi:adenylosuccinate synthase|nr:adenylosuccinate synthetase [Sulfolobales archaeon]MCQ4449499.1 adenylosuccinate synthetase [Sulfolobales archaeon]MDT7899409.1 adenylosuccinate synthetase [Sulfolobales archaeon]PVU73401.1 adenylosuccinate synthetase [Sulfolobales archaeon SCGC AB-777_J03]
MLDLVVGGFYGDEGKGKVIAYLGLKDNPKLAVRTGSINAGHTVTLEKRTWKLRLIPSAFLNPNVKLALGPGVLMSLDVFMKEVKETESCNRIFVDPHVGIITAEEIEEERSDEYLMNVVGSTGSGTGMAEAKRILRKLKLARDHPELKSYLASVPDMVLNVIEAGGKILVEGTQGTYLSLYHGEYPYVTSRNTTASGVLSEVGVGPKYVDQVIVVFKAYVTRVGGGPLEGELPWEEAQRLGIAEIATVTGRKRRSAPFNLKLAKHAVRINSATQVAITKLDSLFTEAKGVKEYSKLPPEAKKWIENIEAELGVPVTLIGTGEDVYDMIDLRKEKGVM